MNTEHDSAPADYESVIAIAASPDAVFNALSTVEGLASWWTVRVAGSADRGGEVRFTFDGPDSCDMVVEAAERPTLVRWQVRACPFLPDWIGTRPTFTITPIEFGSELRFRHEGLRPTLECWDDCRQGWDHYLPSLKAYVESGTGIPYVSREQEAAAGRARQ